MSSIRPHPGYPLQGCGSDPTNLSTVLTTTLACADVDRITSHPELTRIRMGLLQSRSVKEPTRLFVAISPKSAADYSPEVLVLYRKRSGEGIFGERENQERRSVFDTAT
jgi:hypothetical protein